MEKTEREEKLKKLVEKGRRSGKINMALYQKYDVKRGLRDSSGRGVLTGLTEISDVIGMEATETGDRAPCEGQLYYQGYNVKDLIKGHKGRRFGYEEVAYLLMFGSLPTQQELDDFISILTDYRELPEEFTRDIIMRMPANNIMNSLQKCVLSLYSYDSDPDGLDVQNIVRQSLSLVAKMPLMAVYSYHAYRHYCLGGNLIIRNPNPDLSLAENLLQMLHPDGNYTDLEAKVMDVALILHAEHGGGNNSTFTTHVVSSTGTDTYSTTAASLGSLKGPRHGGANLKVQKMFEDIREHVTDWDSDEQIRSYLMKVLDKKAFDHSGLIYGIGHAVYSLSDPRAVILKEYARRLAIEKGKEDEFRLYENVERIGKQCTVEKRNLFKPVCANVDFYSGFVYSMLNFPVELYTPLFAIARISGWSAHRIEEMVNAGKIIRPAYKYVGHHRRYKPIEKRIETMGGFSGM
ncbi:MAG: citrate/2-methylcitrate synthase [Lachnospiraceae bacterium]|jgi:citrate synthase|nr:citrate/2-methylcitrate synthase [Lachnospiraceae bacterium]